jgi:hypothetical protein
MCGIVSITNATLVGGWRHNHRFTYATFILSYLQCGSVCTCGHCHSALPGVWSTVLVHSRPGFVATVMRSCQVMLSTVVGCRARSLVRHGSAVAWRGTHILTLYALHDWTVSISTTTAVRPPSHYILPGTSVGRFWNFSDHRKASASCWFGKRREQFYHWPVDHVVMATEKRRVTAGFHYVSRMSTYRLCVMTFVLTAILMLHCGRLPQMFLNKRCFNIYHLKERCVSCDMYLYLAEWESTVLLYNDITNFF